MAWWIWVVLGAALLAAELFLIDAQFYLVFLGAAAIVVGFSDAAGLGGPPWAEWSAFAALSLLLLAGFRARLHAKRAKTGTALIVPASDVAGMIALATQVVQGTKPGAAGGRGA
jgi:membrane protein implicated in regulation of membrane protease activity